MPLMLSPICQLHPSLRVFSIFQDAVGNLRRSLDPICSSNEPEITDTIVNINCPHSPLSTKFIQLINVKMPTIVGILTFISMIKY